MGEKIFWAKCGHILTLGDVPIKCENPPCPYFTIFGIKYRGLNQSGDPDDPCTWSYEVAPYEVLDNVIYWRNLCLPVDRRNGLVLETKIMKDNARYEIKVYNIVGCFDYIEEFEPIFWGGCEVEPSGGVYPDIFQGEQPPRSPTQDAEDCVENYWEGVFVEKYMLNYSISTITYNQFWTVGVKSRKEGGIECQCLCMDGNDYPIEPDEECREGCEKDCFEWEGDYIDGGCYAQQTRASFGGGGTIRETWATTCSAWKDPCPWGWAEPCWVDDCCYQNNLHENFTTANSYFLAGVNDRASYISSSISTKYCSSSNDLCLDFSYSSRPYDNSYGTVSETFYNAQLQTFILEKTQDTPSGANGVLFKYTITNSKNNVGYGHDDHNVTTTSGTFSLYFDQEFNQLPIANFLNGMSMIQGYNCEENCDYNHEDPGEIHTQPHVTWGWSSPPQYVNNVLTNEISGHLEALDYI